MSINTQDVPQKEITIKGIAVNVPAPFAEGHVLRANEAEVLNQTYAENVRNNTATTIVAKAIEMAGGNIDEVDAAAIQAAIDAYCLGYDFGIRRSGGGRSLDPVSKEAMVIAILAVKRAIAKKGYAIKDFTAKDIREKAAAAVEANPAIMEQAKAVVAQRSAVSLDEVLVD